MSNLAKDTFEGIIEAMETGESIPEKISETVKNRKNDPKKENPRNEGLKDGTVLYVIKDGEVSKKDPEEWKDFFEFYRIKSDVDKIAIIDLDKTKVRPIIKDILNRQSQFLEFYYLKQIRWIVVIIAVFTLKAAFHSDSGSIDASQKAVQASVQASFSGIISEIKRENAAQNAALYQQLPSNAFEQ